MPLAKMTRQHYLIHGDRDEVVPIQQSQVFFEAYIQANLAADFIIKKGEGHG